MKSALGSEPFGGRIEVKEWIEGREKAYPNPAIYMYPTYTCVVSGNIVT